MGFSQSLLCCCYMPYYSRYGFLGLLLNLHWAKGKAAVTLGGAFLKARARYFECWMKHLGAVGSSGDCCLPTFTSP